MSDLFGAVGSLHAALDYHLERHTVLASNVAHVDTPGFHPHDLRRVDNVDTFDSALSVAMERTKPSTDEHATHKFHAAGQASAAYVSCASRTRSSTMSPMGFTE